MAEQGPGTAATETARTDGGLAEENAALKAEIEAIKKTQAGQDQKVAKLLSELDQKEKGKQSAEERIAAIERKAAEAEARAARQEFLTAGMRMASELGVPARHVERFNGGLDELKEYLAQIRSDLDAARKDAANEVMARAAPRPGAGGGHEADIKAMSPKDRLAHYVAEAEKRMGGSQ